MEYLAKLGLILFDFEHAPAENSNNIVKSEHACGVLLKNYNARLPAQTSGRPFNVNVGQTHPGNI